MAEMKAYDTPKALIQNMDYDSPRTRNRILSYDSQIEESYDVPRSNQRMSIHDSIASELTDTFSGETHSMGPLSHYDIPKKADIALRTPDTSMESMMYDIPNANQTNAIETLRAIEAELGTSITRLIEFISFDWRTEERLKLTIKNIKLNVNQFRIILNRFIEFTKYALENVAKADDKRLLVRVEPMHMTIVNAAKSIQELVQDIDLHGWTVENLSTSDGNANLPNDSLDQIMSYARRLIEDYQIARITSFLLGNAALLFNHHQNAFHKLDLDENNRAAAANATTTTKTTTTTTARETEPIYSVNDPNDRPFIVFYGTQIVCHIKFISKAVDAFLQSVERNQPPKYFLTFGKLVISNAFNIINAGDIMHRNMSKSDLKCRIIKCTNSLSDAVKNFVTKTKRAAQHFPSVIAVQEMVDSVIKVSHLAYELKIAILDYLNP